CTRALPPPLAIGLPAAPCRPSPVTPPPAAPKATPPPSYPWAKATLAKLTLEQKVGQMIGVRAFGYHRHPKSTGPTLLADEVRTLKVGTVVVFDADVDTLPRILNALQKESELPLLGAAGLGRGPSRRIRRGVVPLPFAMAIGATRSEEAARFTGEVTAREARALGIHWAFAPVADVNNNPANPIVNVRSYGEDPDLVAKMAAAYVRGAHAGGLLTTAKHFPGHRDTSVDSHLKLA